MLTTSDCVVVQNAVEHIREESDKWEVAVAIWLQRAVGGLTHLGAWHRRADRAI